MGCNYLSYPWCLLLAQYYSMARISHVAVIDILFDIGGVLYQKQESRVGISNYIPQYRWDVRACPCTWFLLLAHWHNTPQLYTDERVLKQKHCLYLAMPICPLSTTHLFLCSVRETYLDVCDLSVRKNTLHDTATNKSIRRSETNLKLIVRFNQ